MFSYLWPCYILLILHLINLVGNFYIHVCLFLDLLLVNFLLVNVQVDYKLITCIINKVYSWFISGIILFPTFSHMGKRKMKYSTMVNSEVFSSCDKRVLVYWMNLTYSVFMLKCSYLYPSFLIIPHATSCGGYNVFDPSVSQSASPPVPFLSAQLLWNRSTEFPETL